MRIVSTTAVAAVLATAVCLAATAAGPAGVRVTLGAHGPVIAGPRSWHPGTVQIAVTSNQADQELDLLHLRPGYSYAAFTRDGKIAQGRGAAARAALARVFAHTVFDGGVDLFRGQSARLTVRVAPGTYYLGEMTRRPQLVPIHVSGPAGGGPSAAAPALTAADGAIRAAGRLPANGTIAFANAGTRPHRINLVPVRAGTTRAQVLAYLRKTGGADNAPPPPFALQGPQIGTADISPHGWIELTFRLPRGTYAAIDFDRDLKTGRPEALEGAVAVVTLR